MLFLGLLLLGLPLLGLILLGLLLLLLLGCATPLLGFATLLGRVHHLLELRGLVEKRRDTLIEAIDLLAKLMDRLL